MGLLWDIIGLLHLILVLYCVIDVIAKGKSTGWKVLWVIVIIVFPLLGPILYLLIGKNT